MKPGIRDHPTYKTGHMTPLPCSTVVLCADSTVRESKKTSRKKGPVRRPIRHSRSCRKSHHEPYIDPSPLRATGDGASAPLPSDAAPLSSEPRRPTVVRATSPCRPPRDAALFPTTPPHHPRLTLPNAFLIAGNRSADVQSMEFDAVTSSWC